MHDLVRLSGGVVSEVSPQSPGRKAAGPDGRASYSDLDRMEPTVCRCHKTSAVDVDLLVAGETHLTLLSWGTGIYHWLVVVKVVGDRQTTAA